MAYSSNPPITKWTLTINAASDTRECKRRWLARCWTPSSSWKLQTEAGWKVNNSRNTFSWDIRRPSENWPSGDQLSGGSSFFHFHCPSDQMICWSNSFLIRWKLVKSLWFLIWSCSVTTTASEVESVIQKQEKFFCAIIRSRIENILSFNIMYCVTFVDFFYGAAMAYSVLGRRRFIFLWPVYTYLSFKGIILEHSCFFNSSFLSPVDLDGFPLQAGLRLTSFTNPPVFVQVRRGACLICVLFHFGVLERIFR